MEGPGPRTWGSGFAAPIHLAEGLTGKHGEFQRKTSQNLNYIVVSIFFSINLLMQSLEAGRLKISSLARQGCGAPPQLALGGTNSCKGRLGGV